MPQRLRLALVLCLLAVSALAAASPAATPIADAKVADAQNTAAEAFDEALPALWRDGLGQDPAEAERRLQALDSLLPAGDAERQDAFDAVACSAPSRDARAAFAHATALINARAGKGDKGTLARLHLCRAALAPMHGDQSLVMDDVETAVTLSREYGDPVLVGDALTVRGGAFSLAGRHAQGLIDVVEAQQLFEAAEDSVRAQRNVQLVGIAYRRMGEFPKAREYLERSLAGGIDAGDWDQEFVALVQLGFLHDEAGDAAQAKAMFGRAVARAKERSIPGDLGFALMGLAGAEVTLERPKAALAALTQARTAFTEAGIEDDPMIRLIEGQALYQLNRGSESLGHLDAAVAAWTPEGNERYLMLALRARSKVREVTGDLPGALADLRREYALHLDDDQQRAEQGSDLRRYEFDVARRDAENQELRSTSLLRQKQLEAMAAARRWQWIAMGMAVLLVGILAVAVVRQIRKARRLQLLAMTDPLTGLANRRRTDYRGSEAFKTARLTATPYSVLALDIDHFKQVNDTHGHAIGDAVLARVGRECQRTLRKLDLMGRIGGEEFSGLLPETAEPAAMHVAERLRQGVEKLNFDDLSPGLKVTISIGVAQMRDSDTDFAGLLSRADAAMYRAKQGGRNRVESDDAP